jgi:hypothetical protein
MTDPIKCPKCKKEREIADFISTRTGKETKSCIACRDKQKARVISPEVIAKRKAYHRNYYLNVFKPKFKDYYETNKDKFIAHSKKHYNKKLTDENREPVIYETINCPCGGKYKQPAITKHSKTRRHLMWLDEQKAENEEQPGLENLEESLENLEISEI